MDNQKEKQSVASEVLALIKKGQVKMRPRVYFILKATLLVLGVIVLGLFVFYLISFIIFALQASGILSLPGFGPRGLGALLLSLPWFLILTVAFLLVILELLVKHFSFIYRRPILYSAVVIILIAAAGSFIVLKIGIHEDLFQRAQKGRLPLMGGMYQKLGMPEHSNWQRVVVLESGEENLLVQERGGQQFRVVITPETFFPFERAIEKGDTLVLMGDKQGDTIKANAVRRIDCQLGDCSRVRPRPKIFK